MSHQIVVASLCERLSTEAIVSRHSPAVNPLRDQFRQHALDLEADSRQPRSVKWRHRAATAIAASSILICALTWATLNSASVPSQSGERTLETVDNTGVLDRFIPDLALHANTVVETGDTIRSVFERLSIKDSVAERALQSNDRVIALLNQRTKVWVKAKVQTGGTLEEMRWVWSPRGQTQTARSLLVYQQADGQWQTDEADVALDRQVRLVSGRIDSSLFAATDQLGLSDGIAIEIAEAFSNDIDFRRDLRKGDQFTVAYEEWVNDGEVIADGQVLAMEFVNKGETLRAIWFPEKNEYFDADGNSAKREFLASPMRFSRVSSGFKMRFHPIQKTWKRHLGVDYAAPTGTPVRSVGRGTVRFAGWQNGYGNVVIVRHNGGKETLYAHLSRIAVRKGQRIEREQTIGAVGSTGWATGPHLHFEFRVDGQHKNPAILAKQSKSLRLTQAELSRFKVISQEMQAALSTASAVQTAQAQP